MKRRIMTEFYVLKLELEEHCNQEDCFGYEDQEKVHEALVR
jgi:hypothetical protein